MNTYRWLGGATAWAIAITFFATAAAIVLSIACMVKYLAS